MHPVEYKLLSILKNGETIHIHLRRSPEDRRFGVAVEASGLLGESNDALTTRLSIVLGALRSQGINFELMSPTPSAKGRVPVWVTIAPRSMELLTTEYAKHGFREGEGRAGGDAVIHTPALGAAPSPDLASYVIEFLEQDKQVEEIRLSFTRVELEPRYESAIAAALNLRFAELMALVEGERGVLPMPRFLALWLLRKRGWEIGLKVAVRSSKSVPVPALELLGKEIFDTECEVRTGGGARKQRSALLDLANRYPDGWNFPRLLPPPHILDRMKVDRIHNTILPSLPKSGMLLGRADGHDVKMPTETRDRHVYLVGATGTGKSTLLARMIQRDLEAGEAVILLDPHGDLFSDVLPLVPVSRRDDLLTINPNSKDTPIAFNILDVPRDEIFSRRVDLVVGELIAFFRNNWDIPEAFGPMFEMYFRNTIMLMMHQPAENEPLSLAEFESVMADAAVRRALVATCTNPTVVQFWQKVAEKASGEASLGNITPYITCKVSPLIQIDFLGRMIGAKRDALKLEERLNKTGIVLVNLNKGMLGPIGSSLLGSLMTTQLMAAGLKRSITPRGARRPVNVYIDEFQNFLSESNASMLSEARKFGLRLHVANQHLGQLSESRGGKNVGEAVLGNVGSMILFRLGVVDSDRLKLFCRPFKEKQMQQLPNFHALVRLLTPEGPIPPFVMETIPL